MRLLFIDFTLPQLLADDSCPAGGWAVQLRQILIGLAAAGHRAGVLTWKGANDHVGSQSVCDLVETFDHACGIRKLRLFYYRIPALFSAARQYGPDVIIQSCSAIETGIMASIARWLRVPFVHRIASDGDTDGRYVQYLSRIGQVAFRYGLKNAQLVICQNGYQLEKIRQRFPGKPACVIHNAIMMQDNPSPPLSRSARSYVAWVGNFTKPKNIPLLYDTVRKLPDIEFRVAGMQIGADIPETAVALKALRDAPNVKFAGYLKRTAIPDFLRHSIALLCTSDFEGFSNTFLESFAAGAPVVTRSVVDPDSIIALNALGRVAYDEHTLAIRLREICELECSAYETLSLRCKGYVEAHHSPALAVQELLSAIQSL